VEDDRGLHHRFRRPLDDTWKGKIKTDARLSNLTLGQLIPVEHEDEEQMNRGKNPESKDIVFPYSMRPEKR
jgi:hypothetical protein